MGRYVRSSTAVDASSYSYLTLRSGRRVPAAGGGGGLRQRHRRGGRRCGKNGGESARRCGVKSASSASRQRRCKAVNCSQGGEVAAASSSPSPLGNPVAVVVSGDDSCGERNVLNPNSCSGEVVKQDGEHNRVAAGRPSPSLSPPEAEIEAFFAAAELAERRRFAETYNYDIALDCPLQGRFKWEPVSM